MSTITNTSSDADLLELLRVRGPVSVTQMAEETDVTPTAVRQRLSRLLAGGLIRRRAVRSGRGRPRHDYELTEKGLRETGSNFADLAIVLWRELGFTSDPSLREMLIRRVAQSLAAAYSREVHGETIAERMETLSRLLSERHVPFSVEHRDGIPVLTAHACPYPELADKDSTVCAMERQLFSELLKQDVVLAHCRLRGGSCCRFEPCDPSSEAPRPE